MLEEADDVLLGLLQLAAPDMDVYGPDECDAERNGMFKGRGIRDGLPSHTGCLVRISMHEQVARHGDARAVAMVEAEIDPATDLRIAQRGHEVLMGVVVNSHQVARNAEERVPRRDPPLIAKRLRDGKAAFG